MSYIPWPKGYGPLKIRLRQLRETLLTGCVLAIDPATGGKSQPGYAVYRRGVLVQSGIIELPKKLDIYRRLPILYDAVRALVLDPPDILVIEAMHSTMTHDHLMFAVGATLAATRTPTVIELPVNMWKAVAKGDEDYKKGDEQDAIMIGFAAIQFAREQTG
jgi:hypothetical protein